MGREVAYLAGVLDLTASPPALVSCSIRRRESEPAARASSFVGSTLVFEVFEAAAESFEDAREKILRTLFGAARYETHVLDPFCDVLDGADRAHAISLGFTRVMTRRMALRCNRCGKIERSHTTPPGINLRCRCGSRDVELTAVISLQCDKSTEYISIPFEVKDPIE